MLTNLNIFDKLSEHVSGFDGADTATKDDTTRNTKVSKASNQHAVTFTMATFGMHTFVN